MINSELLSQLSFSLTRRLPMIRQTEISECGLACLAMVAGYHGYQTNIIAMRKAFPVGSRGMNLQQIVELAQSLNMSSRGLELELHELAELKTPCILHWDLNHFVVLKSVSGNTVVIHDPAIGVRTLTMDSVGKSFTGIALEVEPGAKFEKKSDKPTLSLSQFWKSLKGIKSSLALLFGISAVVQLLALLTPLLNRFIIDDVIVYRDHDFLFILCAGFALTIVFTTACNIIRSLFVLYMSKRMSLQISNSHFSHLIRLPMSFFIKRHTGDIISRFSSLGAIQNLVTTTFVESSLDGLLALCTLAMMAIYSIKLSLITLVAMLMYFIFRAFTLPKLREMSEEALTSDSQERTTFLETLHSMQPIKMFHKEQDRQQIWQTKLAKSFNVQIKNEQMSLSYSVINKLIFSTENILVLFCCAHLIMSDNAIFSVGMMSAYLQYKSQFTNSITSLIDNFFQFKMVSLHLERLADIALHDKDRCFHDKEDQLSRPTIKGAIEIKDLGYRYDMTEPYIFQGLNLSIEPGTSTALVGPSGCGKTTLMKVILGLLEPTQGQVLIDNQPLEKISARHYRTQVASVMQSDTLLSGSIFDNITFFDDNACEKDVRRCAQLASIDDDIMQMPMGYQTLCGELGSQLSGGQVQRILIARALYIKPKILFLDEATSHLDLAAEKRVSQAISQLKISRIIIAHRPETIQTCDRVVLINTTGCLDVTQGFVEPSKGSSKAKIIKKNSEEVVGSS